MTAALEVRGVKKRFGGVVAVDGVDLDVQSGMITGLIGPNGSGKSTLIDLISGTQTPDAGEILQGGRPLQGLPAHRIARMGVVRTFQMTRIFGGLTVLQNLLVADPDRSRAQEWIGFLGLDSVSRQMAGLLSYGQQKLVELGTVLMLRPSVILLDEPGAGINPALLEDLKGHLLTFAKSGIAILLVEHNVALIREVCTHLVAMDTGRVIATGDPDSVFDDPAVREAYLGG